MEGDDRGYGALDAMRRTIVREAYPFRSYRRHFLSSLPLRFLHFDFLGTDWFMVIRLFQPGDLPELRRITIEGFEGIAIDQNVENQLGVLAGHDWKWRKARHVDEDCETNPFGVFVAVEGDTILGYISTRIDREARKGRIPNLAVDAHQRGHGVGRALIEHAIDYLRAQGMAFVMIETMVNNPVGQHLYPSCGFVEAGRQIHYAMKL
jgi:GNAT superfamily N-acetyltransferase